MKEGWTRRLSAISELVVFLVFGLFVVAPSALADSPLVLRQEKSGVDPAVLDGYVGYYRLNARLVVRITHDGGRLFAQATKQPRFELYPETDQDFFARVVDVQVTVTTDPQGHATQYILHQHGVDTPAQRIDEDTAKKIEEEVEKKHQEQTASPGAEGALRRIIGELHDGKPNYDLMSQRLAQATRQQLSRLQPLLGRLGSVVSVSFNGVGPGGADIYEVNFENGSAEWRIALDEGGKIDGLLFRPPTLPTHPPSTSEPSPAKSASLSESEAIEAIRAELQTATDKGVFIGAVLISRDGVPVFEAASSYADLERKIPNGMETKFRVGSMNKMFTAVAVLQLVQAGKVQLTDPIGKYLPDYPNRDIATKVTIDHLLSHTGGTGDIFGLEFDAHRQELRELKDYVALYGSRGPDYEPGSKWTYSNYGFVLLGAIIEHVTGQSYYDYVREHVFLPAGMTATDSLPEASSVPGLSVGYIGSGSKVLANTETLPYRGTSAGGGYSTVGDMIRFATALTSYKLINAEYVDLATTGRADAGLGKYGYGFFDVTQNGMRYFGHGGGAPGMNGELRVFPSSHYVIAVLANLDPPAASKIADFAGERLPRR
jgi:CubicO group peptidase (beta-lactamase class C family)